MNSQTKLNNSFAIRSFLSLVGGVVITQVGSGMGRGSSSAVNWYFMALCSIYGIVPLAMLRAIWRSPAFSRRLYALVLNVAALVAILLGVAFSLRLL